MKKKHLKARNQRLLNEINRLLEENETLADELKRKGNIFFMEYRKLGIGETRFGFVRNGILRVTHTEIDQKNLDAWGRPRNADA